MRTRRIELCLGTVVLALALVASAWGQGSATEKPGGNPGGPKEGEGAKDAAKSKLEELLAQALRDNPDVRVAAAKAAEAEAVLSRARLQVVQKVVAAFQAV